MGFQAYTGVVRNEYTVTKQPVGRIVMVDRLPENLLVNRAPIIERNKKEISPYAHPMIQTGFIKSLGMGGKVTSEVIPPSVPVKLTQPTGAGGSSLILIDNVPLPDFVTLIDNEVVNANIVIDQNLMSRYELLNEIDETKMLHQRPMRSSEYDNLLKIMNTGKDNERQKLYTYELSAIARIIRENVELYDPSLILDPMVENLLNDTENIDIVLKNKYYEALEKWRRPFLNASIVNDTNTKKASDTIRTSKGTYVHPMLRYGLLKNRG